MHAHAAYSGESQLLPSMSCDVVTCTYRYFASMTVKQALVVIRVCL